MTSNGSCLLTTAGLLGETWRVFRTHFTSFLRIMVPPALFVLLVTPLMFLLIPPGPGGDIREDWDHASPLSKAGIVLLVFVWNGSMVRACSASISAASEFYLGRSVRVWQVLGCIRRKSLRLFWLLFMLGIFSAGQLALATVPVTIACVPAIPVAVLENLGVREAIKRSSYLTEGGYPRVVLLLLLHTALVVTAAFGLGGILSVTQPRVDASWVRGLIGVGGIWLVLLVPQCFMIALTLNYYDQRLRKENRPEAPGDSSRHG